MYNLSFSKSINQLRDKLIDTSKKNKLINYKRQSKSKNLIIIDESLEFIYNSLIKENNKFKFNSIFESTTKKTKINKINLEIEKLKKDKTLEKNISKISEIDSNILNLEIEKKQYEYTIEERAIELGFNISIELPNIDLNNLNNDKKYLDNVLQTLHYSEDMDKILTSLERDSKNIIEETGSNMLYLIIGLLRWKDLKNSNDYINSPLITIPIILNKIKSVNKYEFTLEYSGECIDTNKSLAEKLNNDYGIILPELNEESNYIDYIKAIKEMIKSKDDWSIRNEISIDFLKFGKILMYQDLKEENWNNGTPLSEKILLKDMFEGKEISNVSLFAEEYDIDSHKIANDIPLVMDADSSQHSAIVDVLNGKNVVIEGPPGTGKSQTISNLIAVLLAEGKSILFVSEKLAALEVVYKRLENVGLSDFCLELHSNKSNKTKILDSIKKRVETKYFNNNNIDIKIDEIENKKIELKEYINLLHKKFGKVDKKIYNIFWLVEKYYNSSKYLKFNIKDAKEFNEMKFLNIIEELKTYKTFLKEYNLNSFYWNGLNPYNLNFIDIESFMNNFENLKLNLTQIEQEFNNLNLNLNYNNEYDEIQRIYNLMIDINKFNLDNISTEILSKYSLNNEYYNKYIEIYSNIKNNIFDISNNIRNIENNIELFDNSILNINQIDKILKSIRIETNLSNNTNIEYINQLNIGINYISNINLELLICINHKYIDNNFLSIFNNFKNDLKSYNSHKKLLSTFVILEKIDEISLENIIEIENIIKLKKNFFFNLFDNDYKIAKHKIESSLINKLPSNKNHWDEIIVKIKEYILLKTNIENNNNYIEYFGKLFFGVQTKIEDIEYLYNFVLNLKKEINISEIINLLLCGDNLKYNFILSYKYKLLNELNKYNDFLIKIENQCDKKFYKKLFYDKTNIDIIELKENLEKINSNIENYYVNIYKHINININNDLEKEIYNLLNDNINTNNLLDNIKSYDVSINDLLFNLENFIMNKNKILILLENNVNIDLSYKTYDLILNTKKLYNFIENFDLDIKLKENIYKNFNTLNNLKNIYFLKEKINNIYFEIEKKAILNDDFFGKNIKVIDCINKLNKLNENKNTLSIWINYKQIEKKLINFGLEPIIFTIQQKLIPIEEIIKNFKYNFYNTLLKDIFKENETFNKFNRLSHEQTIKSFKELDEKLIELNRQKIAYLCSQKEIPFGYRGNKKSDLTEYCLIENEINKKKRNIPIRQLVLKSTNALKALKPCFMMSPLSVSQYLQPNQIEFDILIIDEASQLRPEEALGAIARVKQMVIVGDPKQLPPTSFFDSINKNEVEDDEETITSESESILDICLNLYKPIRQLRWHYRSKHENLIDFSNQQFYNENLIVFPSPSNNNDELGVKYHYVENSNYQNGRNKIEAIMMIEQLENQMKNYPNKSIGIGTLNSNQRDLIQDMIDKKEKVSNIIFDYINKWSNTNESFFVKNLENLQGDERDVIFISTVYGKDRNVEKVFQRFGPINSDMGWRRLNVLLTRSKEKMEIFTSLKSSDIIVSENSSKGINSLKSFLNYVEKGIYSELPKITNKNFDSEFEESVYNILKEYGYECVTQVGVAGYFIDLSVKSIDNQNDFVLAIECDGAKYHSSKSAKDRDILKQNILENLGWEVYRIWSVDWFKNREYEIIKLIKTVKESQLKYKNKFKQNNIKIENDLIIDTLKEENNIIETNIILNNNLQKQISNENLKNLLIKFREDVISQEFKIDKRSILSDMMIELFVNHKPINIDEFRTKIPKRYRDERIIHIEQLKYLNDIFDILELGY